MFAIYDIEGRRFRSSLEQLERVRATEAGHRLTLAEQPSDDALGPAPISLKAKQAYRQMLHLTEREAILHAYQLMSHPVATVQASGSTLWFQRWIACR